MYSRVIVEPPVEPLTLAEVKVDRAVDHDEHDDLLTVLIKGAREHVERYCVLSLITQTREAAFDSFTCNLQLPYGPVQEIVSVEYVASGGVATALTTDDYQFDLYAPVARIAPVYLGVWPSTIGANLNAVTVRYIAGYTPVAGSPTDYRASVPAALKVAMKMLIGNWYVNREAAGDVQTFEVPYAVDCLLAQYKLSLGLA